MTTRRTKIYHIAGTKAGGGHHWGFAHTQEEAKRFAAGVEWIDPPSINAWEYDQNRAGIARLMNDFIEYTCINEN